MSKARILIVEDEGVIALDIEHHLSVAGHNVVGIANSGEKALERAMTLRPDLILMDIVIKGDMDGIETARRIRARLDVPILFLTAFSDEATIARAGTTAAHGYLLKPFRPDELRAALVMALQKHAIERQLLESEARFRSAFDHAAIGMVLVSTTGEFVRANQAAGAIFGTAGHAMPGGDLVAWSHAEDREALREQLAHLATTDARPLHREHRFVSAAGETIWTLLSLSPVRDPWDHMLHVIAQIQDISDRKRAEARLAHLAHHDALTGLPNRSHLIDWLNNALVTADRRGTELAVAFIDLDGFKLVNDTLGHRAGDCVLETVGARLRGQVRASDIVARLGGDEFVMVLPDVSSPEDVGRVIEKCIRALSEPIPFEGHPLGIGASAGISLFPSDGSTAQSLLVSADRAMYRAKELGRNNYQFFTDAMTTRSVNRLSLERDLRRAFAREELSVVYEAVLRDGRSLTSVVASPRWEPDGATGMTQAEFAGVAERSGLAVPIGEWTLRAACAQVQAWRRAIDPDLRLRISLSSRQFLSPSLLGAIRRTLADTGLPADSLDLELPESSLAHDADRVTSVLDEFAALGIHLWLSGFAEGSWSLRAIRKLPLRGLKIGPDPASADAAGGFDAPLVEGIVALARCLGLEVACDGVVDERELDFLRGTGCSLLQGPLFGTALPAREFAAQALARTPVPAG
ncbi:MAG: diguanylate cyclase [Betaproteobacteria bacterium]|nr:diguanylate cyclase [Betaproteobacteria bacterium]